MKSIVLVLFLYQAICAKGQGQPLAEEAVRVESVVLREGSETCPSNQALTTAREELKQNIATILANLTIIACGGPGWRRVGYLDMTDPSQSCPPGLALKTYSPGLRSCGRGSGPRGCWSTFYSTGGSQYSRVCGRVRGYQFGRAFGFSTTRRNISDDYVTGVSLTHGQSSNRTHIWTFAVSTAEVYRGRYSANLYCPCVVASGTPPPSFVGNNYFCESGLNAEYGVSPVFYPDDPLWDGQNCSTSSSCCEFNSPPYFTKTLPTSTTDDIELRICSNYYMGLGDSPIDQVELYVQ